MEDCEVDERISLDSSPISPYASHVNSSRHKKQAKRVVDNDTNMGDLGKSSQRIWSGCNGAANIEMKQGSRFNTYFHQFPPISTNCPNFLLTSVIFFLLRSASLVSNTSTIF